MTQADIAYEERLVAQNRVKMLTNIWESRKLYKVTFRLDDDRTGNPMVFEEWHRRPEEAETPYRYKVKIVLLENTPTIDATTKKITRHPVKRKVK